MRRGIVAAVIAAFAMPAGAAEVDVAGLVSTCEPCHGIDGIARDSEVPHLAGQNLLYLVNQLKAFRSSKRKHREMDTMARPLGDAEIEALAAYFSDLPR